MPFASFDGAAEMWAASEQDLLEVSMRYYVGVPHD
jgi:hypothetical protein